MQRRLLTIAVIALAADLLVAGCGGGSNGESNTEAGYGAAAETTSSSNDVSGQSTVAVVSTASVPKLGRILVDAKGFTLYDFHKDKGRQSSCYGACAKVWPPLTSAGPAKVGEGARGSKLGTVKRQDGTLQVTYAGHPLYTYTADVKAGDVSGNDFSSFGAQWYALLPSGEEAGD